MERSRGRKIGAVALFALVLLFWISTIRTHTPGFVAPINAEALGFGAFSTFMWLLFLFSARNLYRRFRT
jgi:hypothetical protein